VSVGIIYRSASISGGSMGGPWGHPPSCISEHFYTVKKQNNKKKSSKFSKNYDLPPPCPNHVSGAAPGVNPFIII